MKLPNRETTAPAGRRPCAGLLCGWRLHVLLLCGLTVPGGYLFASTGSLPEGFVYIDASIPDIRLELRYCSTDNFTGERIDGYLAPRGILTRRAAEALASVQQELRPFGLGLKILDAYRPQQAVDHFVRWAQDLTDTRTKARYYPGVEKHNLFREGYIAVRSSHSRGSTVDLTLVSLNAPPADPGLDMGSGFDFFGKESWPHYSGITPAQRAHRLLLRTLMLKHGFMPYPKEWWHFTLQDEPYPGTWFDFPVE
jgi:D-alanyl-D-alanine dipeptidase